MDHRRRGTRVGREGTWNKTAWLIPPVLALAMFQTWLLVRRGWVLPETGAATWLIIQLSALFAVTMLLWRLYLVARYHPVPSVPDSQLPWTTVIVPAYNEGEQVYHTLRTLVSSDYPRDRLRIIAVDDGSVDDTWRWIRRAGREFGSQLTTVRCPVNRGKRAALMEGFSRAYGDVVVTVDSDSEVQPDSLRNLVSPFVVDPRVGTVAGNVRVLNDAGPLGRMLDVAFTYAFEFIRASESMVDTVACCPGALTACRLSLVERVKSEWNAQEFLGRPANIGEDRALTSLILREGYVSRLQSNAIVLTEVPHRLSQLCRMFLRWERSDLRETISMGRFIFTRFREGPMLGARLHWLWSIWRLIVRAVVIVPGTIALCLHPVALGWVLFGFVMTSVLPASVFAATRGGFRGLWAFPYSAFSFLLLSWITPWAMLTPHQSSWLTRQSPDRTRFRVDEVVDGLPRAESNLTTY